MRPLPRAETRASVSTMATTHLGPDGTTTYTNSIAEYLDALHAAGVREYSDPPESLLVVAAVHPVSIHASVHYGTVADLDSWDPFAADDGWPGPAVSGYSCLVSPLMPVCELWRHLGRADHLRTYNIGDSCSISTR